MNFLYLLRPGRGTDHLEMRYSLRSVAKHHPNATVYVVGEPYDWMQGVNVLPYKDTYNNKIKNVTAKIKHATEQLPDGNYVYMNDDFILLKPWIHATYYDKTIKDLAEYHKGAWRGRTMEMFCRMYPNDWLSYENHRPHSFRMQDARHIYSHFQKGEQHAFKTLMGNMANPFPKIKSEGDAKYTDGTYDYWKIIDILRCISVSPSSWTGNLKQALDTKFPQKSKYEV